MSNDKYYYCVHGSGWTPCDHCDATKPNTKPYEDHLIAENKQLLFKVIENFKIVSSLERELDEARAYALGLREFICELYGQLPLYGSGEKCLRSKVGEVLAKSMPEWLEDITKVKQEFDLQLGRHEE